jgi:hypothetical protein
MGGSYSTIPWLTCPRRTTFKPIDRNIDSKKPIPKIAKIPTDVLRVVYSYSFGIYPRRVYEDDSIGGEIFEDDIDWNNFLNTTRLFQELKFELFS